MGGGGTKRAPCGVGPPSRSWTWLYAPGRLFAPRAFDIARMPVWVAAYRYQDKPYQFLVNGQTGEVVGKSPYSIIKIVLFILFIVAVVAGIAVATRR